MDIDGPCYYCQQPTNSIAGNPGLWPLRFTHPDGTGVVRFHHTQCVLNRLRESPCPNCGVTEKVCVACGTAKAMIEAAKAEIDRQDEWWTKELQKIDVRVLPITGANGDRRYELDNPAYRQRNWLVEEMKRLGIEDRTKDDDYDTVLCNVRAEAAEKTLKDLDRMYQAEVERNGKVNRSVEIEQEAMQIGIASLKEASSALNKSELIRDKLHTAICVGLESLRLSFNGEHAVKLFQEGYKHAISEMQNLDGERVIVMRKGLPTPTGYETFGQDLKVMESKMGWRNLTQVIRQQFCKHFWRPAVTSRSPAKLCDYCEKVVELSKEQFYAEFGRMPDIPDTLKGRGTAA